MVMTKRDRLIQELECLPDTLLDQVLDFVAAVATKHGGPSETAIASESSLAKDWSRAEEDEAWADL